MHAKKIEFKTFIEDKFKFYALHFSVWEYVRPQTQGMSRCYKCCLERNC